VQFPVDQPMPYPFIRKIVAFRMKENLARAAAKEGKEPGQAGVPDWVGLGQARRCRGVGMPGT
jgi:hypothetical protein